MNKLNETLKENFAKYREKNQCYYIQKRVKIYRTQQCTIWSKNVHRKLTKQI